MGDILDTYRRLDEGARASVESGQAFRTFFDEKRRRGERIRWWDGSLGFLYVLLLLAVAIGIVALPVSDETEILLLVAAIIALFGLPLALLFVLTVYWIAAEVRTARREGRADAGAGRVDPPFGAKPAAPAPSRPASSVPLAENDSVAARLRGMEQRLDQLRRSAEQSTER